MIFHTLSFDVLTIFVALMVSACSAYAGIIVLAGPANKTSSVENAIITTAVTDAIVGAVDLMDFSFVNVCNFIILKILYLIILTMLDL